MKSDNIGQPKMKLVKWFRNVINNSNVAFAKHNGLTHLPIVLLLDVKQITMIDS